MIHHCVYFKVKPAVTPEQLETMIIETRINLLKIPEVMNLKTGKSVKAGGDWHFFLAFDCESMAKLEEYRGHPVHIKYVHDVIEPNTCGRWAEDFEMEPGKNVQYS